MGLQSQESTSFDLLPTADVAEMAGRLWVPQSLIMETTPIVPGTTLQNFLESVDRGGALVQGFGLYQLTREPAVRRQDGYLGFTFAKPKTAAQLLTPFNEETIWIADFDWPAVLQVLIGMAGYVRSVETEAGFNGGTATSNATARLEARERLFLVPQQRLSTEVIVREYQSPTAFDPTVFFCDPPVPMQVSFSYLGMQRSLVCLHERITVPEQMTDATLIEGFGTDNTKGVDWSRGQIFQRTNHTKWDRHIYRIDTGRSGGVYTMKTYEAQPPEMPDPLPL